MTSPASYENLLTYATSVNVSVMRGNIDVMATHDETMNIILDTNQELTKNWTTGPGSAAVQAAIKKFQEEIADGKTPTADEATKLKAFITQYMASGSNDVTQFSQAVGAALLGIVGGFSGPLGTDTSMYTTIVNSFNSVVTSKANNEEQPGQTMAKTEQGVVQNDANAQQTQSNIASKINDGYTTETSLLQQAYAG